MKKSNFIVLSNVPILEIGTFKDDACDKISWFENKFKLNVYENVWIH